MPSMWGLCAERLTLWHFAAHDGLAVWREPESGASLGPPLQRPVFQGMSTCSLCAPRLRLTRPCPQQFAFLELSLLTLTEPSRREAIFKDVKPGSVSGGAWAEVSRECLLLIGTELQRAKGKGKLPSAFRLSALMKRRRTDCCACLRSFIAWRTAIKQQPADAAGAAESESRAGAQRERLPANQVLAFRQAGCRGVQLSSIRTRRLAHRESGLARDHLRYSGPSRGRGEAGGLDGGGRRL